MIKKLSITYLILMSAVFFFGCGGAAKEGNKNNASEGTVSKGEKYSIDTTESVVTWQGSMLFDFKE